MMNNMLNRPSPALSTASIGLGRFSRSTPLAPECCGGCGRNTLQQRSWRAYRFRSLWQNFTYGRDNGKGPPRFIANWCSDFQPKRLILRPAWSRSNPTTN